MRSHTDPHRSLVANVVFGLLNPIPFGMFVAALVFDIVYFRSPVVMWEKSAAWLIAMGLVFAIIPRLINLVQVWITGRSFTSRADRFDFWLNLFAIVAAIFNAFVHSRDAYAVMPAGVWLSAVTVALISIGHILIASQDTSAGDRP
jgi:uncharacterized membrane protein